MSKLNIDQKSVKALFTDKKADFLIPDYPVDGQCIGTRNSQCPSGQACIQHSMESYLWKRRSTVSL